MAPKKKTSNGEQLATRSSTAVVSSGRVTRSKTNGGKRNLSAPIPASPKKKAKTAAPKKKEKAKPKEEEKQPESVKEEEVNGAEDGEVENDVKEKVAAVGKKPIVIEHCKQCNSFKVRANHVKAGLEKAIPGIVVELNPEKPRRGCFEVREQGGEVFISLENMKRPFQRMKDIDMDEVVEDIVSKIK
ncbi:Selenoprotein H [Linum perenne]